MKHLVEWTTTSYDSWNSEARLGSQADSDMIRLVHAITRFESTHFEINLNPLIFMFIYVTFINKAIGSRQ